MGSDLVHDIPQILRYIRRARTILFKFTVSFPSSHERLVLHLRRSSGCGSSGGRYQACAHQPGLEVAARRHFVIIQTPTTWFACPLLEATKVDRPFLFAQHPPSHITCLAQLLNFNSGSLSTSVSHTHWVTHMERHKQQRVPSAEQTAPASASCQIAPRPLRKTSNCHSSARVPLVLRIGYSTCLFRASLTVQAAHNVAHTTRSKSHHGPSPPFQPSSRPAPHCPCADTAVCLVRRPCHSAAGFVEIRTVLHHFQLQLQVGGLLVPHSLPVCLCHIWHRCLQGIPRPHEGWKAGWCHGSGH